MFSYPSTRQRTNILYSHLGHVRIKQPTYKYLDKNVCHLFFTAYIFCHNTSILNFFLNQMVVQFYVFVSSQNTLLTVICTTILLSQCMIIVCGCSIHKLFKRYFTQVNSQQTLIIVSYSTSIKEQNIICCFFTLNILRKTQEKHNIL